MSPPPITVIFDGVCNLCNAAVDFIIRRDPHGRIRFAAQQSDAGRRLMAEAGVSELAGGTMIVIEDGRIYARSTAALRIARRLRAPWPLLYIFIIVPPFMRNAFYNWIARHRYGWFGKRDACRVPTDEERERFL